MFKIMSIKEFKYVPPKSAVLAADVFAAIKFHRGGRKQDRYSMEILDCLCKGMFCGLVTSLEYKKARNIIGKEKFHDFVNSRITHNDKARCLEVVVTPYLQEYEKMVAYEHLFKLTRGGNMRMLNLTSIITSVELSIPLVSWGSRFWVYQRRIREAFRERHAEERVRALIQKEKPKDIELCTPQDFRKLVLPRLK